MPEPRSTDPAFLEKITSLIEDNISNEQFSVSELADQLGMSRSNLLRKVQRASGLSVSQFIRKVRLHKAMELLKEHSLNVTEVSYKVGFNSTSYFIKCFHEAYGFPPGEVSKRAEEDLDAQIPDAGGKTHQLAAIMFTDIEGYTALMQHDEKKAIEYRNRHREVFNTITKKFDGNILQYYGDGTLSTFASAIDAVKCGIEMQLAFRESLQIPVRMGIHSGDIIFSKEEVIGDGVNVASRIESLASAGSIFISEKVYDEVKNQTGIQTASMGIFELKNVAKPVEVFAITNMGLTVPEKLPGTQNLKKNSSHQPAVGKEKRGASKIGWVVILLAAFLILYLLLNSDILKLGSQYFLSGDKASGKKSIAVLPFINDSNDTTNVYIINGLMESILNNLQKIEDLRVISRTSVEKYRNSPKLITEIADELNVDYFVEGSGQKIDDKILLNVQLIEASADQHIWAEQYSREVTDIFELQQEVARKIADKIEVFITPEEEERIQKVPTQNLEAYDYFLKGMDLFYNGKREDLFKAIGFFHQAIAHDQEFARAYANIAISYYFVDAYQSQRLYADSINSYSDKALLYDAQLPQSLIAKALYYVHIDENELAVPYLEKALEYNPNSALVINILSDFYTRYSPNTKKYLEYALKGISLDIAANDSILASYIFLHVSNAFIQSGFVAEAERYINKSLSYYPQNLYSEYVKAYILYARNRDLRQLRKSLTAAHEKDPSRIDIIQEVGKTCYYLRDYDDAYNYYEKFDSIRKALHMEIYRGEDAKIGVVYSKIGKDTEAEQYFADFKAYADHDESIYKHLSLSAYHSWKGDVEESLRELKLFSQEENYYYWIILFIEIDPLFDNVKDKPEFMRIVNDIKVNFQRYHDEIKVSLEEEELI